MATVSGPLHSESASGQIGKSQIFQTYNNRTYVKKYAVPGNTPGSDKPNQSDAQLAHQAEFKLIADAWNAASDSDKASWSDIATNDRISNYAAYTRENWKRYATGEEITTVWPAVETTPTTFRILTGNSTTPNIDNWTATFENGGNLTLDGNDVLATNDLQAFTTNYANTADGIFNFTGLTALQFLDLSLTGITAPPTLPGLTALSYLDLSNTAITTPPTLTGLTALQTLGLNAPAITTPPTLTGLTALQTLSLNKTGITTPPTLTGLTALQNLGLNNSQLTEVDSIFNAIAADCDKTAYGYIDVSAGTSPAPTAASAAAIATLTTNGGNWTIVTN